MSGLHRTTSQEYGLEDIAIEYYRELIKRNLIEPTQAYCSLDTCAPCRMWSDPLLNIW
jgi:hypothetical protein